MKQFLFIFAAAVGFIFSAGQTVGKADTYTLDWQTIHGGAGTSSGGPYRITGLVRRAGAGTASGSGYTESGGLDPQLVVVPASPELPALLIRLTGTDVNISWAPNITEFLLESTDTLTSPLWSVVVQSNPVTLPITAGAKYYRLRKP